MPGYRQLTTPNVGVSAFFKSVPELLAHHIDSGKCPWVVHTGRAEDTYRPKLLAINNNRSDDN